MKALSGLFVVAIGFGVEAREVSAGPPSALQDFVAEGLEFTDPLIGECMALVREGRADEAISQLNQAIRSSAGGDAEKNGELKLGLAMVYLRIHRTSKATNMLRPLSEKAGPDSVVLQSLILLRAAKLAPRSRKAGQDWASVEGWQAALTQVVQDFAKTLEREHAALSDAIHRRSFDEVSKHLAAAQQQVDLAELVKLPDPSAKHEAMLRKHLAALRNEVIQFNTLLATLVSQADALRAQPTRSEYVGRHQLTHRKVIQDPDTRAQYDQIWNEIDRTADAGRILAAEYHRLLAEDASLRGFDQRLAIRVPARRPWHP